MIFVTVGTHEQQFDRLLKALDELVVENAITDEVFAQIGSCSYEPMNFKWVRMLAYDSMQQYMREADVIVSHGGPSTFMNAIACGKTPVVVPRLKEYDEHVNNHQADFVIAVAERQGGIIPVFDMNELCNAIEIARNCAKNRVRFQSNNEKFVRQFSEMVDELFQREK